MKIKCNKNTRSISQAVASVPLHLNYLQLPTTAMLKLKFTTKIRESFSFWHLKENLKSSPVAPSPFEIVVILQFISMRKNSNNVVKFIQRFSSIKSFLNPKCPQAIQCQTTTNKLYFPHCYQKDNRFLLTN